MTTDTSAMYELRIQGHLDDVWGGWLGDVTISRHDDGTSTLTARVADQPQLHGVLAGLRDMGATLLSFQAVGSADVTGRAPAPARQPALEQPMHTERLTLRAAKPDDADATWQYRRLASVGQWLTSLPVDFESYRATFVEPDRLAATIAVERNGHLVGDLMLRVEDAWAQAEVAEAARGTQAELGWVLDPTYAGQGYATEAVRALLHVCFDQLGLRRVVAICFLDNTASWRLMERVGMRREVHCVSDSLHRSGVWLDSVTYALLAEEWRATG
jgi:RimJ/RimL family protein N-acetyltransferase